MKRCILALSLLLAVACNSFEPFTFVHMSDTQIGFIDKSPAFTHSDSLMKAAILATNALKPAYVFITGDLLNEPDNAVQDSVYCVRLADVEAPVYAVPGNHDYLGFTREKQEAYISRRGYSRFSFQDKGCAFIGIDSNCIKDDVADAEQEQWDWLVEQLNAARKCKYTFIFLHCPVVRETMDEPEDYFNFSIPQREKYMGLFKEYGVDAIFAGHTHQEYASEVDGIKLFTAGPVANALGHGTPGYNVVTVTADGVQAVYTPTPGVDPAHCRF